MITGGLVSVTFRNKTPLEICELCLKAGLKAIEWGGDVHVPHGDIAAAEYVRNLCVERGIEICAYGSYFRVGDDIDGFKPCVDCAAALGAPVIRVWCGRRGSQDADEEYRRHITESLIEICSLAAEREICVAPEFHGGTLTDDPESVRLLMEDTADIPNLRFYWQPRWDWPEETRLETLRQVMPRLAYIHTFTWKHIPEIIRLELETGKEMWEKVLKIAPDSHMLIEFVENDSDESLMRDAETLNRWILQNADD